MFPLQRNRRLRQSPAVRALVREHALSANDFIVPLFVVEGTQVKEEIPSMPDYYRMSLDLLTEEVKSLWEMGLKSVLLFCESPRSTQRQQRYRSLKSRRLDATGH